MSSNSSGTSPALALVVPDGDSVAGLMAESFDLILRELPAAHTRMCGPLSGSALAIEIDGEKFGADFAPPGVRIVASVSSPVAHVHSSTKAILDLIDAKLSLRDSILCDDVFVLGPLPDLVRLRETLSRYIHGAIRCPSSPELLERFRRLAIQHKNASSGVTDE